MKRSIAAGILLCALAGTVDGRDRSMLRILRNQKHLDGAGCYFHLVGATAEGADVFQWNLSTDAWINVNGLDVKVILVRTKDFPLRKDKSTVGDRRTSEFASPGVKVVLETRITRVCPEDDESCEAWWEEGTITVTAGRKSRSARVAGECGS